MVDVEGTEFKVDPVSRSLSGQVELTPAGMIMVWDATEVPGGTVKVICRFEPAPTEVCHRGFPLVFGYIEVANESPCQLRAVQFPRFTFVPGPKPAADATLVFPRAHGRSWRNPFDAPRGYLVGTIEPAGLTGDMEMQFATLYDEAGNGLYWACYDGEGYHKREVLDNTVPGTIEFKLEHLPEDCTPGQTTLPPVALATYRGDWWMPRACTWWALQQSGADATD